jgi:hypothetical protein
MSQTDFLADLHDAIVRSVLDALQEAHQNAA